jgi:hypothetical protein
MIKMLSAATLGAGLLLTAAPSAADPFQSFMKACVMTGGDTASAISTVTNLGWKPIPAAFTEEDGMSDEVQDLAMHVSFDPSSGELPDQMEFLMTGTANGTIPDMPNASADLCGILATDTDFDQMISQISSYLGGEAHDIDDGHVWIYSRRDGRVVLEPELADLDEDEELEIMEAVLRDRQIFAIFAVEEEDMSGLMMGALRSRK